MRPSIELICEERERQIMEEGFDSAHDDQYENQEILRSAIAYLLNTKNNLEMAGNNCAIYEQEGVWEDCSCLLYDWPWDESWWKPESAIRDLTKAGALIAAQIEQLQRIAANTTPTAIPVFMMDVNDSEIQPPREENDSDE